MAEIYAEKNNLNFIALDLQGDPNQDGEVNIADVVAVSSYVADSEKNPLSEQGIINADVHNSGNGLDANDCLMIQQYIADNIFQF